MELKINKRGFEIENIIKFKHPIIVPNNEELAFMEEMGQTIPFNIPIAVGIQRFTVEEMSLLVLQKDEIKKTFENVCDTYREHEFIFYSQFREGYRLTPLQSKSIEEIQKTDKTRFMLSYEPYTSQNSKKFIQQLNELSERNEGKIIIPLLDPAEKDLMNLSAKAHLVTKHDYKICGVFSRHYNYRGWNRIMPILKEANVYVIVLGVYPRYTVRNKDNEYSLLVPPLLLEANAVCHGLAWSGGRSKSRFLQDDWIYHYDDTVPSSKHNYRVSRVGAIIQANIFCKEQLSDNDPLSLIQTVDGFRYFAKEMGISDKGGLKRYL
jgi:hypothetical protein